MKLSTLYSIILFLLLNSCGMWRNDFGITAKTYNNFTKDDAEKYNYILDESNITYKDKNGKDVLLTQDEKYTIMSKVNQCLIDAGYWENDKKTKTMVLNLDFAETETKDAEIYYDDEMIKRYKGKYNFDFEPYIGPKNKTFLIFKGLGYFNLTDLLFKSTDNETFINYSGKDKAYFIGLPNYSNFGGITSHRIDKSSIDVNCEKRFGIYCEWGKTDLSNVYVKLSGKEDNMIKFDIKLHYKQNLLKSEKDIEKTRENIINHFVQYICLFIGDNMDDIQIIPTLKNKHEIWDEQNKVNLAQNYAEYQYLKNQMNNSNGNMYTIIDKITNKKLNYISLSKFSNYRDIDSDLYGKTLDKIYLYSYSTKHHFYHYYLYFYNLKYPLSQLEIKNNYLK